MQGFKEYDLTGKRLLILGGTSASLDLVKMAKEMGVFTVVTDDCTDRVAKKIADDCALVSTTDMDGLLSLIKEKNIDGVFCGPSEFNIKNVIKLCELAGLPCYATMEQWEQCANKDVFKQYCRKYNVDCTPEYDVNEFSSDEELEKLDYPVIVKPVDGCSSYGITVCESKEMVRDAYKTALEFSKNKRVIVEKYIENDGALFGVRYLLKDGVAYPYLLIDTYVTDPVHRTSLTSAFTYTPSKHSEYYMKTMDENVRNMLSGMGLKNGTAFIQALPYKGKIYFHEMGFRLSGGFIFKLTEPLKGVNDMKMMIRYALGGPIYTEKDIENLNNSDINLVGAQVMVPLNSGIIDEIKGLDVLKDIACIRDFIQYYEKGDCVEERFIGTLSQHFGRFTLVANSKEEIFNTVRMINENLIIKDIDGNKMNAILFDLERVEK